jgi:hypothetical protein
MNSASSIANRVSRVKNSSQIVRTVRNRAIAKAESINNIRIVTSITSSNSIIANTNINNISNTNNSNNIKNIDNSNSVPTTKLAKTET